MIDSKWRLTYQKWMIEPLLKKRFIQYLHPQAITGLALFFGLLIPIFLSLGLSALALMSLALSGFLDTLDGSLARHMKLTSPEGAVFDITSDRFVEFAILLGLFLINPQGRGLLCFLMLGSILFCITSFLVVGIFTPNETEKGFHYSPGLMERTEAFAFFATMMVFPKAFLWLSITFTLLVTLTAFIRLSNFFQRTRYQKHAE